MCYDRIYARGASDDKGQIMAMIAAVEAAKAVGPLPVSIKFMLEGEEMLVDIPEKEFERISLKRRDKMKLYFPPDAFHVYSELFKKLI